MLIRLTELVCCAGHVDGEQLTAVAPDLVEQVSPGDADELPGYGEPFSTVAIADREEPLIVAGGVNDVLAAVQGSEESALERLRVVKTVVDDFLVSKAEGDGE